MVRFALVFPSYLFAGDAQEVIAGVLAGSVNQQILFLIHEVLPVKLAHFEIRCKLNRVRRAGLFAKTAEDAAREVDPEKLRISPAMLVFGRLERDAIDRTGDRAEVTRYTAL